jgi:class 3 adenylate cyclase
VFPDVKYARAADDTYVAYAVFGTGPIDLVYAFGYLSNIDSSADDADSAAIWQGLSSFARLIVFDRRGAGLSDRTSPQETSTLEAGMDDIRVVMDAVGSERALLVGAQDGGMLCALFAASYPERTLGLVTFGSSPRGQWAPDYPWGQTEADYRRWVGVIEQKWGTVDQARWYLSQITPDGELNADQLTAAAKLFRSLAAPGGALAIERMLYHSDVRSALPAIRVPALVLHTVGNQIESIEVGRYLASAIPGARLVELPGTESLPLAQSRDRFLDEVRRFATEIAHAEAELDRVLATVLFTDIVDSTAVAATMGDSRWRSLLNEHDTLAKALIAHYRGTYQKSTGDGLMATFDGPARAVRCGQALIDAVRPLGIQIRVGTHTGEITRRDDDIAGLGVHVAARVTDHASASQVWASSTVKDLTAGSGITFQDAGEHILKGVPERWHLYRVVD